MNEGPSNSAEWLRRNTEFSSIPEWVPEAAVKAFGQGLASYVLSGCRGFWLDREDDDGHTKPEELVKTIGKRISELGQVYNSKGTQSPIEDMLIGALMWLNMDWGGMPEACLFDSPDKWADWTDDKALRFWIKPQAEIAGYRVDILMWFSVGNDFAGVAIECDGHAFHEKTKEQASRDKKRDREILKAGFPVVRFSGSDIFKSPEDCASQVGEILSDALDRMSRKAGLYA